jgi:hypothetical protein
LRAAHTCRSIRSFQVVQGIMRAAGEWSAQIPTR